MNFNLIIVIAIKQNKLYLYLYTYLKNTQLTPRWRWKRWYETWLCIRQIGQTKSSRTTSTITTAMVMKGYSSLSSWLAHFTTLLVVLSVMPFGK